MHNSRKEKNEKNEKIITILLMIAAAVMLFPILAYAAKSTPAFDDFSNAVSSREYWQKYGSSFAGASMRTKDYYMTVGGYYFAGFINFFVSPFLRWDITGLRAVNVIIQILFYGSAFFMIREFVRRRVSENRALTWLVFDAFVFVMNDIVYDWEIYTWHTVLIAYLVPLALFMLNLGLTVIYDDRDRSDIRLLIPVIVLAFLVSGSSLNISALNCGMFLLVFIQRWFYKKDRKPVWAGFAAAVAGALVNAAAPGNFVRHDSVGTDYSISSALKDTVSYVCRMLEERFTQTLFPAVVIIMAVILYRCVSLKAENGWRNPFPGLLIVLAGTMAVDFPVCFGYAGTYFPVRCVFVQDMAFYTLLFLWLVHFTGWLQERTDRETLTSGVMVSVLISCMLFTALVCKDKTGDEALPTRYMGAAVLSGRLDRTAEYQIGLLDEIKNSKEPDIVLYRDEAVSNRYFESTGIRPYPDHWINESICDYYGKKSLYIEYGE